MDLVITPGKSLKNREAFILLTPDAQVSLTMLNARRAICGVPKDNPYVFARMNANSSLSGTVELRDLKTLCPGLEKPERITATNMRKYAATVTQVKDALRKSKNIKIVYKHRKRLTPAVLMYLFVSK